jgi:hypothetical protein
VQWELVSSSGDNRSRQTLILAFPTAASDLSIPIAPLQFWRNLKAISRVKIWKPLIQQDLEERIHLALIYYGYHQPHSALGGATPSEIYSGTAPAHRAAIHPPRGRRREIIPFQPPAIAFLDADRTLPILVSKAA